MIQAYAVVGCGLVVEGVYYFVAEGLMDYGKFSALYEIAGFAIALLGGLNILNLSHGRTVRGIRAAAVGANLVLLGVILRNGITPDWSERSLVILVVLAALLSTTDKSLSRQLVTQDRRAWHSMVTSVYLLVAGGLVIEGVGLTMVDLVRPGIREPAIGGFAVALIGVMNVLNRSYGHETHAVRIVAVGANLVVVFGVGAFMADGGASSWSERLAFVLLLTAAMLSQTISR